MRKYLRYAAVSAAAMSLFLALGCRGGTLKEAEGNNSFATANPVELQKDVEGYLQTPDDRDFFSFEVKQRMVLDISLSGIKGINHSIKVWKNSDQPVLLKLVDDTRKSSPERMNNLTADPGIYYVSIQHGEGDRKKGNTETAYKFRISYRDFLNEEAEPDDNALQATAIETGQEISGYYSPAYNRLNAGPDSQYREEDWFSVSLECEPEAPRLLDITLSGVPGINAVLAVYDPDRQLIMEYDNNPSDQGEEIKGLGVTVSGIYYIMVTTKGHNANFDSPYFISVNTREYDPSMELEPNNVMEKANDMSRNIMRGNINSPGDEDYYRYRVTISTRCTVCLLCRMRRAMSPFRSTRQGERRSWI